MPVDCCHARSGQSPLKLRLTGSRRNLGAEEGGGSGAGFACRQREGLLRAALEVSASQGIRNRLIEGMTVGREGWHLPIRLNRARQGVFVFKNSTQTHSKLEGHAQEEKCLQ